MALDQQYRNDNARLSVLIEKYTSIPQDKVFQFVMENTAEMLLPYANKICETEVQRQKLAALFEFKNLCELVKRADNHIYHFNNPADAKEYFARYFADKREREHFAVAYMDVKNKLIKTDVISVGSISITLVSPREILKEALFVNASAVMLAHNHPSGDPTPSSEDIELTARVKQGMEIMGINVHDHIIVGSNRAVSLAEMGEMPEFVQTQSTIKEAKPQSIKQQLSLAKQQFSREPDRTIQNKKHDRGSR